MAIFNHQAKRFVAESFEPNRVLERPEYKGPHDDLLLGLESNPKRIPGKYFDTEEGLRIFAQIQGAPDYYLSRCEDDILTRQAADILSSVGVFESLNIVQLGVGRGRVATGFLQQAQEKIRKVVYRPVDGSGSALKQSQDQIHEALPDLPVIGCELNVETGWAEIPIVRNEPNLILYLGATLGRLQPYEQRHFFRRLRARLRPGDFVLTGFDLKKDFRLLQSAYDDSQGLMRDYNFNLLKSLNESFRANFNLRTFRHLASYNPSNGSMESWMVSQKDQNVFFADLKAQVHFEAFEAIHVETAWKFSLPEIKSLAALTGFESKQKYFDDRKWFVNDLWSCAPTGAFF